LSSHPDVSVTPLQTPVLAQVPPPQVVSLGWALRRTALWLAMLFAMVVVGAWLFYASIDPDEAAAGPITSSETSQTGR
jgi:hypothetical protein